MLGEYISALSNAAAFHYKPQAYFVWGVNDETHEIVGTTFNQYCDQAFTFRENSIVVTIPLQRIKKVGKKVGDKVERVGSKKTGYWKVLE